MNTILITSTQPQGLNLEPPYQYYPATEIYIASELRKSMAMLVSDGSFKDEWVTSDLII